MSTATAIDPPVSKASGHKRMVLILGGLAAFGPLSIDMYLPAFPDMSTELSAGASSIQLTLTAVLLGLAVGQLVSGPLSDSRGRRTPLLIGLIGYVLASLLCAVAPSVWALIALRFVQGFVGAAGIVISRAIARDLHSGRELAKFFALLMLVNGLAPILAPIIGSGILTVTTWRGVFVVLAAFGLLLFVACATQLRETLPVERRRPGGLGTNLRIFGGLLKDAKFMGYALVGGLGAAVLFAYISGSSFVLQDVYGLDPTVYAVCFGLNAVGIVTSAQVGARLLDRYGSPRLLTVGTLFALAGSVGFAVSVLAGFGLYGVLPSLFIAVCSIGLIGPNASALALDDHAAAAGSASALMGLFQFLIGAAAAPLVGLAGSGTAVPMAAVMLTMAILAVALRQTLAHERRHVATTSDGDVEAATT